MNQADKDHEAWQQMNQKAQYRELIKAKELGLPHHINQHGDVVIEKKDEWFYGFEEIKK
jgi:hypothetical protein